MYTEINVFDLEPSPVLAPSPLASPEQLGRLDGMEKLDIPVITPDFSIAINSQTVLVEPSVNEIIGTGGRDVLTGTALSDRIIGGFGADIITGGSSADIFVYQSIRDAGDIIKDLELRQDVIDLSVVLTSVGYQGFNPIADGYIQFGTYTGGTVILLDSDGKGSLAARPYIYVENVTPNDLSSYPNHFIPNPGEPPQIEASLVNDTGVSSSDRLTFDPTISGKVSVTSNLVSLKAGLNNQLVTVDIFDTLNSDGGFNLTSARLAQINGGVLNDGAYTLKLQATDNKGNISSVYSFDFVLDTTAPILDLQLDPNFDSAPVGDLQTTFEKVNLLGTTEANLTVSLQPTGVSSTTNDLGEFTFANISLSQGSNLFTVVATDLAGNRGEFSQTFQRLTPQVNAAPTNLNLTPASSAENVPDNSIIGTFTTTDPDAGDTHTYSLVTGEGDTDNTAFTIVDNELRIKQSPDFEAKSVYSIRVKTTDAGGLGYEQIFSISITNVNEVPTALNISRGAIAENTPANSIIGTFSSTDPDVGDIHTYTLVTGEGDTDNTAFTIVDNELRINESPDFETKSVYSIRVKTTDAGGLGYEQIFSISITNVNEAPTALNISRGAIAENIPANSIIGTFSTTDPDVGDTHTYSLVSGEGDTDNTAFTIVDNELRIKQSPDFEAKSVYSIRVRTTDAGGLGYEQIFSISITNVNEAPVIEAIATQNINEQTLFTLTVKASDPESDTLIYTLDASAPPGVSLDSTTGVLTWTPLETQGPGSYPITIRVTDGQLTTFQSFTVNVAEVNTAPILTPIGNKNITLGETLSFKVTAVDSDSPVNNLSFSIDDGAPQDVQIDPVQGTFSWTPTTAGLYPITIRVKDDGSPILEDFEIIQVAVIASNLPPTDITLAPATISENVPLNTVVGVLSTVDPNGDTNFIYALVSGDGDSDNNQFVIDGSQVKLKFSPDFEAKSTYTIRVRSTDSTGLSLEKALTIKIADVNESPTNIILSNATIAENSPTNTFIGSFTSLDPDLGDSFTYNLVNDAGGRFAIAPGTNQLVVADSSLLDFEQGNTHTIRVKTTDIGGLSFEKDLTISITNVNEAPFFTSTPVKDAEINSPYQYLITTGDPESDRLTVSATNLPSWLSFVDHQDGTAVLSGNPQFGNLGIYTIPLTVTDTGGLTATQTWEISVGATLREGTNFSPELTTNLLIPNQPQILSFQVEPNFDLSDRNSIKDAFEVALVDSQGNSLVHSFTAGRDSFFNITEGLAVVTGAGTNYNPATQTVTVNLTGIAANTNARLIFRLVNNDSDTTSSVGIKEINLSDAPLETQPPLSSAIATLGLNSNSTPLNFTNVADVTPSLQLQYQRTSFNEDTQLLYTDVVVKNIGSYGINTPLIAVVKNISDPSVQLRNIDGYTPEGLPYYNFSQLVPDGKLNPEQVSSDRSFVFYNPLQVQFTYDIRVYSVLNQNPVIQTQPALEIIGGQSYQYDVNATDPDQDPLTYQLLIAPQGLEINPTTGLLQWNTNINNIGNHHISIQVSDGRGGITQQTYTLAVIEQPPNRPPIFISTPVVDAAINQPYKYDADAVDPDQDPLTYSLVLGPDGMKVNPTTGLVEWTPPSVLTLGDTVIGRISIPGEVDEFTVSGVAGQRIYIDTLQYSGDYWRWQFKVYSPSGLLINDSRLDDNKLLNLPENGNYRIVLRTDGDLVGTYGFRVIDQNLVPIVPLDTFIQNKLSPGSQDHLYRFTGSQRQKLFFDQLSNNGNLDWVIYNASNQVITSNNFNDIEIDLPVAGEYTLAVRGREAFTSSVDYAFSIITPEIVNTPLSFGSVITGAIAEKGEQDTYTFSGEIGQRLYFDVLNRGGVYTTIANLYSPSGRNLLSRWLYEQDPDPITFTEAGTYRLVIDGNGESTDHYSFSLLDVGQASAIALDTDISGQLDPGQETHFYKFNGTAGQRLYFDALTNLPSTSWLLYNLSNQALVNQGFSDYEYTLSQTDTYLLAIRGNSNTVVDYQFRIITPEFITASLTIGNTVSSNISEKGEQDTYTFSGEIGQRLYFDILNRGGYYSTIANLYSPSGRNLLSRWLYEQDPDPITFTEAGTYRLVIDGNGESTDHYSFSLLDVGQASAIALDTDISGQLDPGQETHFYKFNGTAGQRLYFDALTNLPSTSWLLYNLSNQALVNQGFSDYEYTLSQTDTYLLAIRGNSNTIVDYQFRIITPEFITASLTIGHTVSSHISEKGEQDTYTFSGEIGQRLYFDVLNRGGVYTTIANLYSPSGRNLLSRWLYEQDPDPITFTEAGTYRLVIDGNGESTDHYSFSLLDVGQASAIALDTDISGQLDPGQETHFYKFNGTAGQRLYFDALTNLPSTSWLLYNLSNQALVNQGFSDYEYTLSQTDTYLLAIRGNGNTSVDYQFRIITPELTTATMTIGNTVSGSISEKGEQDTYTFTGTAGQQLFYDALGGDYLRLRFYDPTGREIFNRDSRSDIGPDVGLVLAMNGVYKVVVDGEGEGVGNYNFRFLDKATASLVPLDTDITGTFDNNGIGSTLYRFQVTGDSKRLLIDGQTGVSPNAWILYSHAGQFLTNNSINRDSEVVVSPGEFLLVMQGNGASDRNYQVQIKTLQTITATPFNDETLTLGSTVTGTITQTGGQKGYRFTGTAGQQLFYDALGGDYLITRFYDPTGREIYSADSRSDRGSNGGLTLTMNGNYRVVIGGTGTGNYSFRLLDKATAPVVNLDTDITGTLDNIIGSTVYRFNITGGSKYLYIDAQTGTYYNNWIIYAPNGQHITSAYIFEDREFSAGEGEYLLVMQGNGASDTNYKLRIITPELITSAITLGNTVSGSISEKGEQDTYTFTGTAGQQLFYDALGGDYFRVRFYDPTGREIYNADSRSDRGTDGGLVLSMNGTYRVVIDGDPNYGNGEATGNYSFCFLDKATAPVVNLDTDIIGTLDNIVGTTAYRFNITGGSKYLYLDAQTGTYYNNWIIYAPNGQHITSAYIFEDREFSAGEGEYLLVMQGNGASDTNYKLRIITPELITSAITLGNTVSGSISEKGEQDTYTFTGTAGQQLFYDALGGDYFRLRFYDPTGREIYNADSRSDRGTNDRLVLSMNGTYRVVIDGDPNYGNGEATGNYSFRFLDKATAPVVKLDTDIIGTLDNIVGTTAYRFNITGGSKYLYIDGQAGTYNNQWIIYAPNGQHITSAYILEDREFWAGEGEYLLVMQGNGASDTNYKLRIITPELITSAITLGNTVSGSISEKGEQDTYTFTGTAGQQLFYDALGGDYFRLRFYDPAGREIYNADSRFDRGTDGGLVLSMNGTYRVVIDGDPNYGNGEATGNYSFRFLDKATAPVVNLDTDITGTLDNIIGSTAYRFNITGGSKYLYIDGQAGTTNNQWIIYAPNGQNITSNIINSDREFWAGEGEYLLVMQGNGASDTNYKLRIITPELITSAITLGNTVSGSISEKGEQDTYTFTGTAGQQLFYDALGGDYFRLRFYDPTGREIYNADSRSDRGTNDGLVLSMNGTYRVVIDGEPNYGNGEATGNYSFRFLDKAVATPVTFNTDISGTFDAGLGSQLYRFNAQAGQHFYLDTATGQYPNSWIIYGTGGQYINSGYLQEGYSNNDYEFAAPTTGEYLLVMQGNGAANTNYKFHLASPQFDYTNLSLGNLVIGNIATRGEQDIYAFTGTVGQQLFFDAIAGNPNLKARLYSPTNILVADRDTNSDWSPVNLIENGTYRFIIDGVGTTTGNYSFIVSNRAAASTLTLGNTLTSSLTPDNQINLYKFNGKQGQILNFDLNAATWVGANWTFYDPSGKAIKTPAANNPDFQATLAADGIYTLAIAGNSSTPVNYSFIVTDNSTTPVTNSGLGTLQTGNLNAGQVIDYNFTATAGTKVLFDSLDNNSNNWQIRARLIKPDGTYIFSDYDSRFDSEPILLEQTGNYKLQIFGYYGSTTGSYQFSLRELPNGIRPGVSYLELGGVVAGTLNNLEQKIYAFNGTNGLRLMFNSMTGDNVNAVVYDPNGNIVSALNNLAWNYDSNPYTLTQTGWYNLVVRNQQNATSNFSFQLLELDTAPEISFGLPNTFSLPSGQQSQFYKLQAKAGERLYFDVITSNALDTNYRWKLYGAGNNLLFDQYQGYNAEIIIPYTGEYSLLIQGGYSSNQLNGSFQVTRHSTTTRDIIIPGNGKSSGGGEGTLGLFNVKLAAKDPAGATAIQDYQIRVVPDPENGNPVIISTPQTKFGLDQEVYRYQLKSVDPENDALFYRLVDAPLGASINGDTGELLWFPTSGVKNGDRVTFKVEVSDRRGGFDRQNFEVQVYNALGRIQGAVFDDLNSNGIRDTKLFSGDDPIVVFAVDISGSTAAPFYGTGQYKNVKTVLDAQVQAVLTFMEAVIAQGLGNKLKIGLLPFTDTAVIQDMDLTTPGTQPYTTALADKDNDGVADIKQILQTYFPNGSSKFTPTLEIIDTLLDNISGNPNLIFMSDGYGALDATKAAQVTADIKARGGSVTAFAIGQYATIETLDKIDPNALQVLEFDELFDIFSGFDPRYATEPLKENISVYLDLNNNGQLDGGEPVQITQKDTGESTLGTTRYQFTFDGLEPGTYVVRQVVPSGYVQTLPSGNTSWTDTVTTAGEKFIHLFGVGKVREPANEDPFFTTNPPALTQIKAGETLLYRANAVDPNADPVTYSLVLAPKGVTVDARTGTVVWTPTKSQVDQFYKELRENKARLDAIGRGNAAETTAKFNILLTANDGRGGKALQYVNVEVLPDNNAPIFTSTPPADAQPQVGKVFQYQATAIDPDGDAISFELVNAPTGVTISTTGLLNWTPVANQLGDASGGLRLHTFQIKVKDHKGGESLQTIKATVINPQPNRLPVITSIPRISSRLGNPYFYEIIASDPDGDPLTYTLTTKPEGMTLVDNLITWTPQPQQSGANHVTLRVSDRQGGFVEQVFTINVTHQAANRPPAITSAPDLVTNLEKEYQYNLTGSDPDGDLLLWSLDQAPDGMVIDINSGALRWQPKSTQTGNFTVAVRLMDNYGADAVQEYTLKVTGINTPPQIISTPITKAAQNQDYTYQVVANDPENDALVYSLGAKPVGMAIDAKTGLIRWTPAANQIGLQQVEVFVRDTQGGMSQQTYSLEVVAAAINHAPNITSSPIFLANVGGTESYQYQVLATDPNAGDTLTYQLLQAPTGMAVNTTTGLITWANPVVGNYQVVVAAVDSGGLGVTQGYTLTAKINQLPVIGSTNPPANATVGATYRYDIQAYDPDGGKLTYTLDAESQKRGITIDQLGRLRWTPQANQVGTYPVTVTLTDSAGGKVTQNFNLTVALDTIAPKVIVNRSRNVINKGEVVSFQVIATDNVGIANLRLLINNTPVEIDSKGLATFTATDAGVITAKAIAVDTSGNSAETTTTVAVADPTDTEAPVVSLDLSAIANFEITAPTEIRGTVNDANLLYYALEVAPADGSAPFKEVFRGTQPVTNGVLGVLDPTLLLNDTYQVRLVAYDTNNRGNGVVELLDVKGDLKLGNFQISFADLELSVSGIPITLTRTYDTLTSNHKDDFGYGWRMEFRDADLRTSLPKDEFYEEYGIRGVGFKEGDQVYVTLPGGKRERFTFKLEAINSLVNAFLGRSGLYKPTFVADKGVTSTLSVQTQGVVLIRGEGDQIVPFSGGSAFRFYNPQDWGNYYTLTTKEGITYQINATTGDIDTITNRNGDKLTFSDGGILSSNGQQVTFGRDAQGRIATVTDPMGKQIKYEYDAQGDLIKVTDRENHTTGFDYSDSQPHYLEEIIDSLGRTGLKNEYDQNGRLTKVFNAVGDAVQLEYNPDNSIYTFKDVFGNPTTYEYDVRGNIITEVDALGGITKRTFDDNNNVLSETNPEGETRSYTYDSQGNKLSETDPLGNVTRYTYNANNDLLTTTDALGNTTTNVYDQKGNLLSISGQANGKITISYDGAGLPTSLTTSEGTTTFEYDAKGNLTKEINSLGHEITYTYDANGNRLTETRQLTTSNGVRTLVTKTEYDAKGKVIQVTDAEGGVIQTVYDAVGNKIEDIDANGRVTKYVYDQRGLLIETIYPDATPNNNSDNPRTRKEYDEAGRVIAEIDELGRRTEFKYDKLGRLTFTIFPDATPADNSDNPRTEKRYDQAGRLIAEVDELGNATRYIYNEAGQLIATILPDNTPNNDDDNPRILTSYDALGRQISQTDPLGHTTEFLYDQLGRPIGQILPDQTTTSAKFDDAGRIIARTDQAGNTTRYEYDAIGQLTAVIDALGQRTEYQYNELGNLSSQKDANGNVTQYEYDGLGRRVSTTLPLGQLSTTQYDKVGNIISTNDFNGRKITFEFDERNRLITKIFPDDTRVKYTYTLTGQRATETDTRGTTTYQYDTRDRLLSRTDPDGVKIAYTYDAAGNRTAVTIPSGTTTYTFDAQNRLKTVLDPNNGETKYIYDLAGNIIRTELPNGTVEIREYDSLNRLIFLKHTNANGVINSFRYTLNKVGDRIAVEEQDGRKVEYEYDKLYRFLKEDIFAPGATNPTRTISYTYDAVSNRQTRNDSQEGNTTYEYDQNDRLLKEVTNGVTTNYIYDNNGNTLSKTTGTDKVTYEWDDENRLIGVDTNGDGIIDITNHYDSDGIRIVQTVNGEVTHFLVDKNRDYAQVLEEYTPSKIIKVAYVYGNDLISQVRDDKHSFYHVDGLGSTRALTDINGLLTDSYDYAAFGEIIQQVGNTKNLYLFAGEQFDNQLSQYYLRARYYDQSIGRFTQRDTWPGRDFSPITLHKYLYANANPANYIDPTGNFSIGSLLASMAIAGTINASLTFAFSGGNSTLRELGEAFGIGAITAPIGGALTTLAGPLIRSMATPMLAAVGRMQPLTLVGSSGLEKALINMSRILVNTNRSYPSVQSTFYGSLLKKMLPGVQWQQHHVFIQQAWSRSGGPNQIYNNLAANEGLRRIGNGLWNLMPIPASLNGWLGRSPVATQLFATFYYSLVFFGPYHLWELINAAEESEADND
ncbi:RHS repeat-associated core domain protein [Nostoc sp. PCC 7524]|uniref:putative Ig domain-containing protein n=1 Tax=Nostoc sp. (strain ATCC 29411 / PCC 7524) TaxID=28072 RepID=UPI00029F1C7B|nr:putative Ig domain-containing protein [Nostoc sp. PCC 7524]AFY50369.1 RHS repeat-associated core domain protein [Nostoc sp. PCC 7524]